MLAYNGSIPGPTLKVPEGATVTVHVTNQDDLEPRDARPSEPDVQVRTT
jgi:FtsP/CotA-like multicopper oxidase with cupredoxin domain